MGDFFLNTYLLNFIVNLILFRFDFRVDCDTITLDIRKINPGKQPCLFETVVCLNNLGLQPSRVCIYSNVHCLKLQISNCYQITV